MGNTKGVAHKSKGRLKRNKLIWDGKHEVNIFQSNVLHILRMKVCVLNTVFLSGVKWNSGSIRTHFCGWKSFHEYASTLPYTYSDTLRIT